VLKLDPTLVGPVMAEVGHAIPDGTSALTTIDVSPLEAGLLDAVARLVRVRDTTPADVPFLAPLVTREIVYRQLTGAQSGRLKHATVTGGSTHRIVGAIARLRNDVKQALCIEDLASELGMSESSLHHHFKR
jgi:transcriptional regulator GlxA family with amidase domain